MSENNVNEENQAFCIQGWGWELRRMSTFRRRSETKPTLELIDFETNHSAVPAVVAPLKHGERSSATIAYSRTRKKKEKKKL